MIYKISNDKKLFHDMESYKERNLYYKIFAGYFFNELIDGYENRVIQFLKLFSNRDKKYYGDGEVDVFKTIGRELPTLVTFDYHTSQVIKLANGNDRGESSDILIWFKNLFISIECKYLTNPTVSKDITQVQDRIILLKEHFKMNGLQVILYKETKWENSKKTNRKDSFRRKFENEKFKIPCVILFWEDLLKIIDDINVKQYLQIQLERSSR